jgi:hypothetical protein
VVSLATTEAEVCKLHRVETISLNDKNINSINDVKAVRYKGK